MIPTKPKRKQRESDIITIDGYRSLVKQGRVGKARNGDKAKREMKEVLLRLFDERDVKEEHKFVNGRKFKFDFAIIPLYTPGMVMKFAIEYEGLGFKGGKEGRGGSMGKSGHTTPTGYTSNCDKYNLATILGFRLLRYTALNYQNLERDLIELIKNN